MSAWTITCTNSNCNNRNLLIVEKGDYRGGRCCGDELEGQDGIYG